MLPTRLLRSGVVARVRGRACSPPVTPTHPDRRGPLRVAATTGGLSEQAGGMSSRAGERHVRIGDRHGVYGSVGGFPGRAGGPG